MEKGFVERVSNPLISGSLDSLRSKGFWAS